MALNDIVNRRRYFDVPTHQRKLRHLRSVAARNLSLPEGIKNSDVSHISSYFTLHTDNNEKELYKSELVKGSLNPIWRSFDLNRVDNLDTASSYLVVKVWLGEEHCVMVVEWKVNLTGLVYLGEQIIVEGKNYPPNSVIFGMWDGFFGLLDEERNISTIQETPFFKVEQHLIRPSYDTNMLRRVYTVLRAIKQTEALVYRVRQSIEDKLEASKNKAEKLAHHEMLILKVNELKKELQCRTTKLQNLRAMFEQMQAKNHSKESVQHKQNETLGKDKDRLQDKKKGYFDAREKFVKSNAQLIVRKKQLIAELACIYPISEIVVVPHISYAICGVRLPNSEDFQGQDETMVAVGLGYTAHMVSMIAQFLDVPLRYPILMKSSKSKIHDHVTDKISDRDRDFPLYSKGKDKFHFNYAVYLLNKNIAQIRYYCGMGTNDLRLSLPNLKALLEMRLGVKFDEHPDVAGRKLLSVTTSESNASPSSNPSPIPNPQTMVNHDSAFVNHKMSENNSNNSSENDHFETLLKQAKELENIAVSTSSLPGVELSRANFRGVVSDSQLNKLKYDKSSEISGIPPPSSLGATNFQSHSSSPTLKIDTLNDEVDSKYSMDKIYATQQTEIFEAQFLKSEQSTKFTGEMLPGFRTDICDNGDGSSSDDNTTSKYGSKFKTWQQLPMTDSKNTSDNETRQSDDEPSSTVSDSSKLDGKELGADVLSQRTFKTKAMQRQIATDNYCDASLDESLLDISKPYESINARGYSSGDNLFQRAQAMESGGSSFNIINRAKKE